MHRMKLATLAERLGGRLAGPAEAEITAVAALDEAGPTDLSFAGGAQYLKDVPNARAGAVLVPEDFVGTSQAALVYVRNVDEALEQALRLFSPQQRPAPGVHPTASVAANAELGEGVSLGPHAVLEEGVQVGRDTVIGPGCVLGRGARVGGNCHLHANVVVEWGCVVGDHVIIHANSTIGADGFGYRLVQGRHRKIPHIGIVVLEDDVEIGANSCVDRAKFGRTMIGRGTKIDNLVQVAHNVRVGENCLLVAQAGVAGSCRLGNHVVLGGQVGLADHVSLGDGVQVGAQGGVMNDVAAGERLVGSPARPGRRALREMACVQKLPELFEELKSRGMLAKDRGSATDHR